MGGGIEVKKIVSIKRNHLGELKERAKEAIDELIAKLGEDYDYSNEEIVIIIEVHKEEGEL